MSSYTQLHASHLYVLLFREQYENRTEWEEKGKQIVADLVTEMRATQGARKEKNTAGGTPAAEMQAPRSARKEEKNTAGGTPAAEMQAPRRISRPSSDPPGHRIPIRANGARQATGSGT